MAPHSSTLAWKISWTEEPGRLHSMGSLRVGHDWATSLSLFTFIVPQPGIEPRFSTLRAWSLNDWMAEELLIHILKLRELRKRELHLAAHK